MPLIFCSPILVVRIIRPNFFAKVGYIILTSIPESKSANIESSAKPSLVTSLGKAIGYWIHVTYSSFLQFTKIASSLSPIIKVEVVKTNTSFLALFPDTC